MAGRPRSPQASALTRARVVEAARNIADADGLAAVTMRSVAARLRVEAMSLYNHVSSKEALLDGMVDSVISEFHLPRPGGDWAKELRERSVSAREVLLQHPWAVGLMDSRTSPGLATLRHHDAVLACLRAAGFSLALTGHAFALLDAHLYGFCVQETSMPFEDDQDLAALGVQMMAGLPDGDLEAFKEFTLNHALQPGYRFGDEFTYGLDLVLDGLRSRWEAEQVTSIPPGGASAQP